MPTTKTHTRTAAAAVGVCCLAILMTDSGARAQQRAAAGGPVYKVDPFWPKPLPNKWSMQQIVDMYVDRDDHIWVINRRTDLGHQSPYGRAARRVERHDDPAAGRLLRPRTRNPGV